MTITRINPPAVYNGLPCSMVAVGCALGYTSIKDIEKLRSPLLHKDGYLPLNGGNKLIRQNLPIKRGGRTDYRRGERPTLRQWLNDHPGGPAVICVYGHLLYTDGTGKYYSFFDNLDDDVVSSWELEKE